MNEELEMFEFLESDFSQENINMKLQRKRLRDDCNPFSMSNAQFINRYRLSKDLVRNLLEELKPHSPEPTKSTDLSLEIYFRSSDDSSRRRRATFTQLETLWEFLNSHKEIATGYNKSAQAREYSRRMWESIAEALNSQGEGAVKYWKGWSSYWVDYKAKFKKRAAVVRAAQNRTGRGPLDVAPLTDIEKKFLGLLGDGFGIGLPNIQVDPFPTTSNNTASLASEPLIIEVEEVPPTPHEVPVEAHEGPQEPQETLQSYPTNDAVEPPVLQPERWRRRRRESQMSQEAARRALVELSRERLELETRMGHNFEQLLNTLERIANTLDRIAGGPQPRNEGAPHS